MACSIELKPLNWAGWKTVRTEIVKALQGEVGNALRKLVEAWQESPGDAIGLIAKSGILHDVGELVCDIVNRFDSIEAALVKACCPAGTTIDDMSFEDAAELRQKLIEHAKLKEKFDAEKNCLAAIWNQINPVSPVGPVESSAAILTS